MGRRGKILCSLVMIILTGLITFYLILPALPLPSDGSPVHKGRSLAEWTDIYLEAFWAEPTAENTATKEEAAAAIRAVGTNGLPYLIKWMQYEEPEKKSGYRFIINGHLESLNKKFYIRDSRRDRADASVYALRILGPKIEPVLPELTRLFLDQDDSVRSYRAEKVLSKLGDLAVPAFEAAITNENTVVKSRALHSVYLLQDYARPLIPLLINELQVGTHSYAAASALGSLRLEPEISIPALVGALESDDSLTRYSAVRGLQRFGPRARSAVPALLRARVEGSAVEDALKEIAPDNPLEPSTIP